MTADEPPIESPAEEIFADFLERIEAGESVDFDQLCSRHEVLQAELRRIHRRWQAMSHAFMVLSRTGDASTATESSSAAISALIKRLRADVARRQRYAIGTDIATGAMGKVVRGWDEDLRRDVALKVHRHLGDDRSQRRFVEEAQIAGQLDHPGIVPIHELGIDADGRPFFAMKLVRGRDLGELLELVPTETDGWSRTRVLNVLLRVCEAMAYAHEKGVVHRDLKPQNIMVGRFGETYVMDWGLARVAQAGQVEGDGGSLDTVRREIEAEESDDPSPLLTRDGEVVGTPAYMAPEQANGGTERAAPAADIYAMGAMLYQLLAGHIPYCPPDKTLTAHHMLGAVREGPPAPLPASVPGELRAICDRAMARRVEARYSSMMALADDLRAFLESRVVAAYRTGSVAELRKWLVRNRALAISSLMLVIVLLTSSIVATQLWLTAEDAREVVAAEVTRGKFRNARLALRLDSSNLSASTLWRQHLEGAIPRATHWALVENATRDPVLTTTAIHGVGPIAFSASADAFVASDSEGRLRLLDPNTLSSRKILEAAKTDTIRTIATSPDDARAIVGTESGEVTIWDLDRGIERKRIRAHESAVLAAVAVSDGYVSGDANGKLIRIRTADQRATSLLQSKSAIWALALDRNRNLLAVGDEGGTLHLLSLNDPEPTSLRLGQGGIGTIAFSHDGSQLWVGLGEVVIWVDIATKKVVRQQATANGTCRSIARLEDGSMAIGGWWRIDHYSADGERLPPISLGSIRTITAAYGGDRLGYTLGNRVGVVDFTTSDRRAIDGLGAIGLSRDGDTAVTWRNGKVAAIDVATGELRAAHAVAGGGWLRTNDDGSRVAVARKGSATIVNLPQGTAYEVPGPVDLGMGDLCIFAPGGEEFAVIAGSSRVERRRSNDGELIAAHDFPGKRLLRLSYAQDGTQLAILARHKPTVSVVTLATNDVREVRFDDKDHELDRRIFAVAFDSDCSQMAIGTWEGIVRVRNMSTGALREFHPPTGVVWALAFSPTDPSLLIASSGAGGVTFWDLASGECCLQMFDKTAPASQLQISDDGRTLSCYLNTGPLVLDLAYRTRHVAGGLAVRLPALRKKANIPPGREKFLQEWAQDILNKPWPRWR